MINVQNYRDHSGSGMKFLSEYHATTERALESLLRGEIGFGGQPTIIEEEKVVVETQVFACHDRTIYQGPKDEMAHLRHALALCAKNKLTLDEKVELIHQTCGGTPLLIVNGGPIVCGHALIGRVFAEVLGLPQELRDKVTPDNASTIKELLDEGCSVEDVSVLLD